MKGLKDDAVCLFPWASDKAGDPVGMSRMFVSLGVSGHVGRFVDIFADHGMAKFLSLSIGKFFK